MRTKFMLSLSSGAQLSRLSSTVSQASARAHQGSGHSERPPARVQDHAWLCEVSCHVTWAGSQCHMAVHEGMTAGSCHCESYFMGLLKFLPTRTLHSRRAARLRVPSWENEMAYVLIKEIQVREKAGFSETPISKKSLRPVDNILVSSFIQ